MSYNQESNATGVQVFREQLSALVSANYPEVRSLKVKKSGWYITVRAKWKHRRIHVYSKSVPRVIIRLFDELNRKIYLQPCAKE
jgi:hypothetical protein